MYLTGTRSKEELNEGSSGISRLDLAVANVGSGDGAGSGSRSNVLAFEVTEEAGIGRGEGTRAAEGVTLAAAADVRAAGTATTGNSEVFASSTGLYNCSHILKLVSSSESQYMHQEVTNRVSGRPEM